MTEQETKKIDSLREFIHRKNEDTHSDSWLIAVLHKAQELYGYLPRDVMDVISGEMNIPTAHIWGVATFYHYFHLHPPGRHTISVCLGTACYVKGAEQILDTLREHLGIDIGGVTQDGMFSLQGARCLGACGLAPVVMIDDKIHGDLTPERMVRIIEEYRSRDKSRRRRARA